MQDIVYYVPAEQSALLCYGKQAVEDHVKHFGKLLLGGEDATPSKVMKEWLEVKLAIKRKEAIMPIPDIFTSITKYICFNRDHAVILPNNSTG